MFISVILYPDGHEVQMGLYRYCTLMLRQVPQRKLALNELLYPDVLALQLLTPRERFRNSNQRAEQRDVTVVVQS